MATTINRHLRVIPPETFSSIDTIHEGKFSRYIKTREEANQVINNFGVTDLSNEHFEFWKKRRLLCKIVRVTTIIETDF